MQIRVCTCKPGIKRILNNEKSIHTISLLQVNFLHRNGTKQWSGSHVESQAKG